MKVVNVLMKKITSRDKALRSLQLLELEGLKEIDRICRKHNIKYSLGGGTCLGQVRHGGFIPWDDDIDVDMTTENYRKFLEVAEKELDHNKFFLRCTKNDKNHLRSYSRLELKHTNISIKNWEKKHMKVGIFVDIFEWSYLPNNKILRKIVSSSLFYIRCIQNYKMFHVCAKKVNRHFRGLFKIIARIFPTKLLGILEKKLQNCCGRKKTNWIMDNAIINGNHGGYKSLGIDEYEDVYFEGIKVMNKKNSHNFLRTIYGENYNKWLPPTARISHHKWLDIDFGIYEKQFDLPKNYKDCLTITYSLKKLEHMKKISLEIIKEIDKICKENNIKYYMIGKDTFYKVHDIELSNYWLEPPKIIMPRNDYNKFEEICKKNNGEKYFLQSLNTDNNYKKIYAKFRLNYTYIRENYIPLFLQEKFANNGFFVKIIPLDNTSNNVAEQKKHLMRIKYLNHFITIKWQKNTLGYFFRENIKFKIKYILLRPFSVKKLVKLLNKELSRYNDVETNNYIDSSGYQLKGLIINKDILGKGKVIKYNDIDVSIPSNFNKLEKLKNEYISEIMTNVKEFDYVKKENQEYYNKFLSTYLSNKLLELQKRYSACYLNYYDIDEYQLSILRYDEKNDKLLSNDEIINSKK